MRLLGLVCQFRCTSLSFLASKSRTRRLSMHGVAFAGFEMSYGCVHSARFLKKMGVSLKREDSLDWSITVYAKYLFRY